MGLLNQAGFPGSSGAHSLSRGRIRVSGLLLLLAGLTSQAAAADWPTYRHDNRRSGITNESLSTRSLGLLWTWKSTLPPQSAWAGPAKWDAYAGIRGLKSMRMYDPVFHVVAAGDQVYFGSSVDDSAHCLDATTGKPVWQFTTEGPVRIAPSYHSGRLYFGSDDGHAYCLDAKTGKLRWQFNPSLHANDGSLPSDLTHRIVHNGRLIPFWPCRSGLMIQSGTAYFSASLFPWHPSYLCAVNAINGKTDSKNCYVQEISGQTMEGAMVASETQLIVPQGRVAPQLFDRVTGKGEGALKGGGGSFVVLANDDTIFHGPGNKTGWITSSQAGNRKAVATYKSGNVIVVRGNISYLLSDSELVASDYISRKVLWKRPCDHPYELIGVGNTLFAGGTDEVAAYDMSTGKLLWTFPVSGKVYGLSCANGRLFASTDTGTIYAFGPRGTRPPLVAAGGAPVTLPSNLTPVAPIEDPSLIGRWVFQRPHVQKNRVLDMAGKNPATIEGNIRLATAQAHQALVLDGKSNRVTISDDHSKTTQPTSAMTAESWVRIESPRRWGGIVGAIQDNGAYERGWLLGYCNSSFCFALAGKEGPANMTYLTASEPFIPGQWYHVAATYDGQTQSLYVNGKLLGTSKAEQGDINYPPRTFYEIGSYHDSNENYPAEGMVHEVRVYKRALSAAEIMQHVESKQLKTSPTAELAAGPYLRFTAPDEAMVYWETHEEVPTELTYGQDDNIKTVSMPTPTRMHEARLTNLKRHRRYHYSIQIQTQAGSTSTSQFECDTYFNFNILPSQPARPATGRAAEILAKTPFKRGLCLVVGCGDGTLVQELAEQSQLHIIGFTTDPEQAEKARQRLQANGHYGTRASICLVESLEEIPVTRCCANLITSQDLLDETWKPNSLAEIHRLLQPRGVAVLGLTTSGKPDTTPENWAQWIKENKVPTRSTASSTTLWLQLERQPLAGAGSWSHLYGNADNSAFGGESLQDAKSTSDLVVQWIGRPGPRYQPDRNGRKPSPLSVNGRLFLQGLQRLVALDSYNGTVLWSLEIPSLGRFNMPRDCGNWTADDNFVYVAINDRLWHIDAATGEVIQMQKVPPGTRPDWSHDWGYIANIGDSILGSTVKKGSSFKSFWGGASDGWYDAKTGKATAKVCSEQLFSLRKSDTSQQWLYRGGIILNSTITATEKTIYFVENRNPAIRESQERRITAPELWKDNHLVALDFRTGKKIWEQPIKTTPGTVVFYLAHGNGTLALVSSSTKSYEIYAYQDQTGDTIWDTSFPWTKDNHGGHMSRPAIVGNTLYVRPRVFELNSGSHRDQTIPGGGCGTYACTTQALFFRSGNVTVWDREQGKTSKWPRLRPDCWLSTIPAGGMLLSPEGGGGCSCGSWMETSLGFIPKRPRK